MTRRLLFRGLGFLFCIAPPTLATLNLFPLMTTAGRISACVACLLAVCFVPLFRYLRQVMSSPSAWVLWGLLFAVAAATRAFIDEFYMISMLGFFGSVIGAAFFWLARRGGAN